MFFMLLWGGVNQVVKVLACHLNLGLIPKCVKYMKPILVIVHYNIARLWIEIGKTKLTNSSLLPGVS